MHGSADSVSPEVGSVPRRRAYEVPEVAQLLGGVSERHVWRLLKTKELTSFKSGGRRLVDPADLDDYIARQKASAA